MGLSRGKAGGSRNARKSRQEETWCVWGSRHVLLWGEVIQGEPDTVHLKPLEKINNIKI